MTLPSIQAREDSLMQEHRTERVEKRVVYRTICDGCRKIEGPDPDGWHHFHSGHGDWGNDSSESVEYHDACSWACYLTVVRRVFNDYGDPGGVAPTLTIDEKDWWFVRDMLAQHPETPDG